MKQKQPKLDLASIINDINAGLPPAPLPAPETAPAVEATATPDWADRLRQMQMPQAPTPNGQNWNESDMLAQIQDKAALAQDRAMANMFGDVLPAKRQDTSGLPGAIDRYLDKVLST